MKTAPHQHLGPSGYDAERSAWHAPTGRLIVHFRGATSIGTLDAQEAHGRFILREVARRRAALEAEAEASFWPKDFLRTLADV
ncbi:hypothetical protein NVS89_22375 [Ancylobacter sp. MQZ15Z-1]|uniref:Uncharacterized protein n=1 Tax=Ancylobacter mangrovi TaxID=2972472 RepID=A0A9X2T608_9HYPH|nr:hypothetical protein [Ancylobacter mangrovi]MCS0497841.1 hypothetical protein [Ancylobacter mangrovi]